MVSLVKNLKVMSLLVVLAIYPSTAFISAPKSVSPAREQIRTADLIQLSATSLQTPPEKSYGETSRKFRRSFFTHKDWLKHRSEDRFLRTMFSILESGVVRQLAKEVGIVVTTAFFVVTWNSLIAGGYEDFSGNLHDPLVQGLPVLELPLSPFTLASPALGLLLVFRTNTAYGRWDEARKAWGLVVNHARNIARMGASWVSEEAEPDPVKRKQALERLALTIWTFPRSLQRHLLGEVEDGEEYCKDVRERCPPEMAEGLIIARHKPSRALFELSNAINDLPMTYLRRIEVDKSCVEFANAMGACDRIFTSPVPLMYTRHTARFLGGWLLGMPFAMWASFGNSWNHVGMIPISAIISFFFFGIEELSVQLEEPFSILPLANMTAGMGLSANEHALWHFEEPSFDVEEPTIEHTEKKRRKNALASVLDEFRSR